MLHHSVMLRAAAVTTAAGGLQLPAFTTSQSGAAGTRDWRLFLHQSSSSSSGGGGDTTVQQKKISPWHDLQLHPVTTHSTSPAAAGDPRLFAALTEIPRGTRAKMELCKEEPFNPIKQDVFAKKEGQPLRYFLYGDMPFNYGFLPRTWEDPSHKDHRTGCIGDGDPVDVVHLGKPHVMGQYDVVRVLGVLGLIDVGETDWKIIVESAAPGLAGDGYGSIDKVPQEVKATIVDWFENYKVPDGKKKNEFAFNREIRGAETALEIIAQCAMQYDALVSGKYPDLGYWLPKSQS